MYHNWKYSFHIGMSLLSVSTGFRNAQLISPDEELLTSFRDLSADELNTVARIFKVTSWINDFCEAAEEDHNEDHTAPFRTLCIHCVKSVGLPPPQLT